MWSADLDLFDREWPIWTDGAVTPPAKFVHDEGDRRGMAVSSLVSGGCIVSGARDKALGSVYRRAGQFLLLDRERGHLARCRCRAARRG